MPVNTHDALESEKNRLNENSKRSIKEIIKYLLLEDSIMMKKDIIVPIAIIKPNMFLLNIGPVRPCPMGGRCLKKSYPVIY
jgi:hypothetical protein